MFVQFRRLLWEATSLTSQWSVEATALSTDVGSPLETRRPSLTELGRQTGKHVSKDEKRHINCHGI